jgi:hypothetical protein
MERGQRKQDIAMPEIAIASQPEETSSVEAVASAFPENTETVTVDTPENFEQPKNEPVETPQQLNFRQLREKAERLERERDEAIRLVQEQEYRRTFSAQAPQQQAAAVEEEDFQLKTDDLVEGKHLSKVSQKIKRLEDQLKQYQNQSQEQIIETRIKSQYPDFERIVNKDNIESLRLQYPELAQTINSSTDLYSKAISAYTIIKKMGIAVDESYMQDKIIAQKNATKPRVTASVSPQTGETPLSKANAFANGLTPELQRTLRKEMEDARKLI